MMVDTIFEKMKQVQFVPFNLQVKGLGAFPNPNYPRVVWAGLAAGVDQLKSVFNQLEKTFRGLGLTQNSKGFNPHLTIGRVRSARNKAILTKLLAENADHEFGIINAKCLRLKKSELTPKGPIYSTLKEFCPQE